MLLEHGFPEHSVLLSDVFLGGLDGVSVVLGLSGDHEPMDLLGESSVVGEDVLVFRGIIFVGKYLEDGSVMLLVISSSEQLEHVSASIGFDLVLLGQGYGAGTECSLHDVNVLYINEFNFRELLHHTENFFGDSAHVTDKVPVFFVGSRDLLVSVVSQLALLDFALIASGFLLLTVSGTLLQDFLAVDDLFGLSAVIVPEIFLSFSKFFYLLTGVLLDVFDSIFGLLEVVSVGLDIFIVLLDLRDEHGLGIIGIQERSIDVVSSINL